jgi:hypothetical protein
VHNTIAASNLLRARTRPAAPSLHTRLAPAPAVRPTPLLAAAEVTKRRVPGLHQTTSISSVLITSTPRVSEEGAELDASEEEEAYAVYEAEDDEDPPEAAASEAEDDDEAASAGAQPASPGGNGAEGGGRRRRDGPAPPRYASLVEIRLSKEVRGPGLGGRAGEGPA